jgi:hypothetical protein
VAYHNTDGGWDVKSLRPEWVDCIAIDNKRNFRIWDNPEPAVLENCLAAFSKDQGPHGHDVGLWVKGGGKVTLTRCTIWGDRVAIKTENGSAEKPTNLKLDRCVIVPAEKGKAENLCEGTSVERVENAGPGEPGAPPVALRKPVREWRGGDDSFDCVSHPDCGYKHRAAEKAK